jgi:outer membrane receptor for ferrienterochelin and colicin
MKMTTGMRGLPLTGLLTLVLLLGADALAAQVTTTGAIRGRVMSAEGAVIGEAAVTATGMETGFARSALTNSEGVYMIRLLPPGQYSIRVEMVGYGTEILEGINVTPGTVSNGSVTLTEQALAVEGITVTSQRREIDVTDASVVQYVERQQIEELPSRGRDFTDFINLSGLVAPDPGETTGGQFSIAGQRASQTNVQIDGVDANNSFFGENRGGSRVPFTFSIESIEEFQIITNGYDVEYGQYSGGIVNVVTRGGQNDFEGVAYINYRGDALTGSDFSGAEAADFEATQFSVRASGPLIRNKLLYNVSVDGQRRRDPQIPLTRDRFGPGGEQENPVVFEEIGEYWTILESNYGVQDPDLGYRQFQTTNDELVLFGRVDWTIDNVHRLTARYNFANFENKDEWDGNFDFLYGRSRAELFESKSHSFVTELQSVFNDRVFNVARLQFAYEDRPRNGNDLRPTLTVNLSDGQQIRYGGTFAAFQNLLQERKLQFIDNLSIVQGDHTLKLGGTVLFTNIRNQFQNFGSQFQGAGAYSFPNLEAFENFAPSSYFRPVRSGGGVPFADFGVIEWGLYLQDEWRVTPKLTATAGIRWDIAKYTDAPGRVIDAERAFGIQTGIAPVDNNNVSPRLALAYDWNGDGRSVLRAGVGYFYGRAPYVLGGNVQQTERPVLEVNCLGSIQDGDANAPPSPSGFSSWSTNGDDNPTQCAQTAAAGIPTYTFWQDKFEYPETFKANLGFSRAVSNSAVLSLDLLFSQSTNLYTVRNLNLRDVQFQVSGESGRRIFQPEEVFDPSASDATANLIRSRRNLELGDVFVNFNDGRARAFSGTVEWSQRLTETMSLQGSYTYTNSKDNSSYSCCTAAGGFTDPLVGAFGPNDVGGIGANERAWGPSNFMREHTFIFAGNSILPWDIRFNWFWRWQSGRPWTPAVSGDLNGDGVRFNDRPFVFSPESLPLASTGTDAEEERAMYRQYLADWSCLSDAQGGIIDRGACKFPWFNSLDIRLGRRFPTVNNQAIELQVDFFNVLNGINSDWGRFVGVFGSDQNLLNAVSYDQTGDQILYSVSSNFGEEDQIGNNLTLQFGMQLGLRYFF